MKGVGKTALFAVVILLLGIFSQQETKAGETDERHYSRVYTVLSANVGNATAVDERQLKLRSGSDEEKRVKEGIQRLKPDILILVEAYDKDQAFRICNGTAESYSVHGGSYDFVCVRNDIIAKKENGKQDIKHEQMPGGHGNSVGYVEVGIKDENGRKARLFYVHFPSHFPRLPIVWDVEQHKTHKDAFVWICENLKPDIPCLIAGDLNNDFIRWKAEVYKGLRFTPNPQKYIEEQTKANSSLYIEERVSKLNLWIFNPPTDQLLAKLPDGSTKSEYEATHRAPEETIEKRTLDWVMGKGAVPEFRVPGYRLELDSATGAIPAKTLSTCFVTSPPDWWKDTDVADASRFTFDHKPLYGKVVFFWEDRIQPLGVVATYIPKYPKIQVQGDPRFVELRSDGACFSGTALKWKIESEGSGLPRILFYAPGGTIALGGSVIGNELRGLIDEDGIAVGKFDLMFLKSKKAIPIESSDGKLLSRYEEQSSKEDVVLIFREDGTCLIGTEARWEIKGKVLKVWRRDDTSETFEWEVNGDTIVSPAGDVLVKKN